MLASLTKIIRRSVVVEFFIAFIYLYGRIIKFISTHLKFMKWHYYLQSPLMQCIIDRIEHFQLNGRNDRNPKSIFIIPINECIWLSVTGKYAKYPFASNDTLTLCLLL